MVEDLNLYSNCDLPSEVCDANTTVTNVADADVVDLFIEWGLSMQTIATLSECGIKTMELLKMIHSHDLDQIFNSREQIGEKIKFRYHLQQWRGANDYDVLTCCGSDRTLTNSQSVPEWLNSNFSARPDQLRLPTTSTNSNNAVFDLEQLLKRTVTGEEILNEYRDSKILSEVQQTALVRIICDHYYKEKIRMDPNTMKKVTEAIVHLFPTESASTYYIPRSSKRNPSGKIYDRYFNITYKRKRFKKSTGSSNVCSESNGEMSSQEMNSNLNVDRDEFEDNKKWLAHNKPSNIAEYWRKTSLLRMTEVKNSIADVLKEWPRYRDPDGFELVDIDFEERYPGKSNLFFKKIADMEEKFK